MFGRATEVSQFNELLVTGQHVKGMRLFDQVSKDPALCNLVLDSVVMSNANQSDPSLHTPHAVLRYTWYDLGKLGHHFALAVSFLEAAQALGLPRGLLPIANLGFFLAESMKGIRPIDIPPLDAAAVAPSAPRLAEAVETGAFDAVEDQIRALLAARRTDDAVRPLLVAASADPGFLGHTLILAHAIRRAAPFLEPAENFHLFWKAYRTLVSRFGYPEFLRLGPSPAGEREAGISALRASLQHKTPPAEGTLPQALDAGAPPPPGPRP